MPIPATPSRTNLLSGSFDHSSHSDSESSHDSDRITVTVTLPASIGCMTIYLDTQARDARGTLPLGQNLNMASTTGTQAGTSIEIMLSGPSPSDPTPRTPARSPLPILPMTMPEGGPTGITSSPCDSPKPPPRSRTKHLSKSTLASNRTTSGVLASGPFGKPTCNELDEDSDTEEESDPEWIDKRVAASKLRAEMLANGGVPKKRPADGECGVHDDDEGADPRLGLTVKRQRIQRNTRSSSSTPNPKVHVATATPRSRYPSRRQGVLAGK